MGKKSASLPVWSTQQGMSEVIAVSAQTARACRRSFLIAWMGPGLGGETQWITADDPRWLHHSPHPRQSGVSPGEPNRDRENLAEPTTVKKWKKKVHDEKTADPARPTNSIEHCVKDSWALRNCFQCRTLKNRRDDQGSSCLLFVCVQLRKRKWKFTHA